MFSGDVCLDVDRDSESLEKEVEEITQGISQTRMSDEEACVEDPDERAFSVIDSITSKETPECLSCISNSDLSNALVIASRRAAIKCIDPLLKAGANPNAADEFGYTPLVFLASQGLVKTIERLLESPRCTVNRRTFSQRTALHFAAEKGNYDCAKVLLEKGAMVNVGDDWGVTPLMLAVTGGNINTVIMLLKYGAIMYTADLRGHDAFIYASKSGCEDVIGILLENGYDVRDRRYRTSALHQAARFGHADCVKLLLDAGITAELRDVDNKLPIILATQTDQSKVVRKFMEHGVRQFIKDEALVESAKCNAFNSLYVLLEHNADINARDERGISAFFLAVAEGSFEAVVTILQHGYDVNKVLSAMYLANSELLDIWYAERLGDQISPLMIAVIRGNIKMVRILVKAGANLNGLYHLVTLPFLNTDFSPVLMYLKKSIHKRCPLLLRDQCRKEIRKHLSCNTNELICELPLPPVLIRYLKFDDLKDL